MSDEAEPQLCEDAETCPCGLAPFRHPHYYTDPLDWAGDWHLPGLGGIIREDIARSMEYIKNNPPLYVPKA